VTLEDLAFSNHPSRESDEVGRRGMYEHGLNRDVECPSVEAFSGGEKGMAWKI